MDPNCNPHSGVKCTLHEAEKETSVQIYWSLHGGEIHLQRHYEGRYLSSMDGSIFLKHAVCFSLFLIKQKIITNITEEV